MDDFFKQVEEIRNMTTQIAANVEEVKLRHSTLLSSPQVEDSTFAVVNTVISSNNCYYSKYKQ